MKRMMANMKKVLCLVFSLMMVVSLMPVESFADDVQDEDDSEPLYAYTYGDDGEVSKVTINIGSKEDWSVLDSSKLPATISELIIDAEGIYASDTQDITLDLRSCKNLKKLYVYNACISNLLLTDLEQLEEMKCRALFDCGDAIIKRVDASGCVNLKSLDARGFSIERIKLTGCQSLETLNLGIIEFDDEEFSNRLKSLDVSSCINLKSLNCSGNSLTKLDLSKCKNLKEVNCYSNFLTKLDLSKCKNLEAVDCSYNDLNKLILNSNIKDLNCYRNTLKALDLSRSKKLQEISCSYNYLTKLDLSKNNKIKQLYCEHNNLQSLRLPYRKIKGSCKYNFLKPKATLKLVKYFGKKSVKPQNKISNKSVGSVDYFKPSPEGNGSIAFSHSLPEHVSSLQIQIRQKGYTKWKTDTFGFREEKIIKNLKSGKRYQVRIRGRLKLYGKWYNSKWSKIQTVKVK